MARIHFLHVSIHLPQRLLLGLKVLLRGPCYLHGKHKREGDGHDTDQRQHGADIEHHGQNEDDGGHRRHDLLQTLLEAVGDGVHIVGDAAEHIPVGVRIKVVQGKLLKLPVDIISQVTDRFLGDPDKDNRADILEKCIQNINGGQQNQYGDVSAYLAVNRLPACHKPCQRIRRPPQHERPEAVEEGGEDDADYGDGQAFAIRAHKPEQTPENGAGIRFLIVGIRLHLSRPPPG